MNVLKSRKTLIVAVGGAALLIVLVGLLFRPVLNSLAPMIVSAKMTSRNIVRKDGLYVGLAGTGSPMPDANRTGPCVVVQAGTQLFIVDAGSGSARNVRLMSFPLGGTDALLLTHFHSDHITDLGEMALQRWAGGSTTEPLEVIGPAGVEEVVAGFNLAYALDAGYRVAHHGPATVPPSGAGSVARAFKLAADADASAVVWDKDGVVITAFKVNHEPVSPAVGYRFDYKGRSIAISGDTVYSESLVKHSRGVDLLFHEALNASMVDLINANSGLSASASTNAITHDIPSYHSTPEDAARAAVEAGAKSLVFYHIIPPLPSPVLKNLFIGDAKRAYNGKITMGDDGMQFFLPPGSSRIEMKRLLKR